MPSVLREVLDGLGWQEYDESISPESQPLVNLHWKTNRFTLSEIEAAVYPMQRVNHYPKAAEITHKDVLSRHLKRMAVVHGAIYDFVPVTFVLPNDYVKFCQYFSSERDAAAKRGLASPIYICKPSDLSRGRKIFVFRDISDLMYDQSSVLQRYVDNPLLIGGYKLDFRIYVLVTSFSPLRAFIYRDFIARFSVSKYDVSDLSNAFAHLTNYSVNKNNAAAMDFDKDVVGTGCKWDAPKTKAYFASVGIDFDATLWKRIEMTVKLTLLAIAPSVPCRKQCFELYGFDILFDANFQPWIMEVNYSPALAVESQVDQSVKGELMTDMISSLGYNEAEASVPSSSRILAAVDSGVSLEEKAAAPAGVADVATICNGPVALDDRHGKRRDTVDGSLRAGKGSPAAALLPCPAPKGRLASSRSDAAGNFPALKRSQSTSGAHTTRAHVRSGVARSIGAPMVAPGVGGTRQPSTTATFFDSPKGKFSWVFPYSPQSQDWGQMMLTQPEQAVRFVISDLRKAHATLSASCRRASEIHLLSIGSSAARPPVEHSALSSSVGPPIRSGGTIPLPPPQIAKKTRGVIRPKNAHDLPDGDATGDDPTDLEDATHRAEIDELLKVAEGLERPWRSQTP